MGIIGFTVIFSTHFLCLGLLHPALHSVFDHRMRVKKLPMILALHLKRFKYMEQLQRYTKLSYRVVFPLELRLFNTSGDATNPERLYDLVAVVVHCGRCVCEHRVQLLMSPTEADKSLFLKIRLILSSWCEHDNIILEIHLTGERTDPHLSLFSCAVGTIVDLSVS